MLNPVQSFQGGSSLLTNKFLGLPGKLLIDLAMKPPGGFEPLITELVINHYSFITSKKLMHKGFKIPAV